MSRRIKAVEHWGDLAQEIFHLVGLFVIGVSIIWASWIEIVAIIHHGGPSIKDVLLLFIYLELGAMVGIYFKTQHLPVRFLIYIAITAITRVLAIDIKTMDGNHMLQMTGAILLLTAAVVALKYASSRFDSEDGSDT